MPEPWFQAHPDGLGWRPAGAKGWAALAGFGSLLAANAARLAATAGSVEEGFALFLPEALALSLAFFWLCLAKGGSAPERLWFKAKRFGWGWTPATPEGWIVVGVFIAGLAGSSIALIHFRPAPPTTAMLVEHFAIAVLLFVSLLGVCYQTGEKPGWRWGG